MSTLEDRYRSVLRLLPSSYRQAWEEEMVATFLETTRLDDPEEHAIREDFGRPHWSEVASVVALALRLRLGGVGAPPRSFAWGEAVRRVALVGLLVQAVLVTVGAVRVLWLTGAIGWPPLPDELAELAAMFPEGAWYTPLEAVGFLWVAAFLLLVLDRRRSAQLVAVLALVPSLVGVAGDTADVRYGAPLPLLSLAVFVGSALTVLALAAFHRSAPPVARRPWIVAYVVGVVAYLLVELVAMWADLTLSLWVDATGLACVALAVAAAVHIAWPGRDRAARSPSWSLALALLATMALIDRLLTIAGLALGGPLPGMWSVVAVFAVQAVLALAVLVTMIVVVRPVLRRLPATNGSGSRLSGDPG